MELQKINVKLFSTESDPVPLADFIELFHGWIQATDGRYHDVADYSHMHAGPGIVLVANDANISIDETGARRGLLYNRKSSLTGSNQERLRNVFRAALEVCRRLEQEPKLRGKLGFRGNQALIIINDRLLAPNTEESLEEIKPEIDSLARALFGDADIALEGEADPQRRLSVRIQSSRSFETEELLHKLHNN